MILLEWLMHALCMVGHVLLSMCTHCYPSVRVCVYVQTLCMEGHVLLSRCSHCYPSVRVCVYVQTLCMVGHVFLSRCSLAIQVCMCIYVQTLCLVGGSNHFAAWYPEDCPAQQEHAITNEGLRDFRRRPAGRCKRWFWRMTLT